MEKEHPATVVNNDEATKKIIFKKYSRLLMKASQKYISFIDDFRFNKYDLMQDLLLNIIESDIIKHYQGLAKFEAYLYAACRNYCLKKIKGSKNISEAKFASADLGNLCVSTFKYNYTESEEINKALIEASKQLDFKSRLFIRMFFYDKRPVNEIMLIFNFSSRKNVYLFKDQILSKLKSLISSKKNIYESINKS